MSKPRVVGIDLGTTFSLVAVMGPNGPTVLPNAVGELLTPSAVGVEPDGTVLVGAAARARATTAPECTALSFKRDMGTDRQVRLGGRSFTAPELSSLVLASLKRDAEAALGAPVEEAVITVPAYFGDLQRQATRDAGAVAGLRVERIINEPTAAALAYGLQERHREARVAVLDLGGGTFDVTMLEIIEGVIEIQSSAGDVRLGGDDFDDAVAQLLLQRARVHRIDIDDPIVQARARDAAEGAKKRLSLSERTRIVLVDCPVRGGGRSDLEIELTREEAEICWAPVLDRMRTPIARAMRDAGRRIESIDEVLLVGGSTRMPSVQRLAAQVFGRMPLRTLPPDEAVAMGAAVQAALKMNDAAVEDVVVTDVAPFTLGVETSARVGGRSIDGVFTPILERGTVVPASREKPFFTMEDGQHLIKVQIFQGEHALSRDNQKIGELVVRGIPPARAGEQRIDIRFTYDLNGILEIDARVASTGQAATMVIEQRPGALSRKEIEDAQKAMSRLKMHPRDALPNTTALARADALYVELTGDARLELAQKIAWMRGALDSQDPKAIEAARLHLIEVVSLLRR